MGSFLYIGQPGTSLRKFYLDLDKYTVTTKTEAEEADMVGGY